MKRLCVLLIVLALALPATALASDMIPKAPPPPREDSKPAPTKPSKAPDYLHGRQAPAKQPARQIKGSDGSTLIPKTNTPASLQ